MDPPLTIILSPCYHDNLPTGIPVRSACNCINKVLAVIPPSTCKELIGIPLSLLIDSNTWKKIKYTSIHGICRVARCGEQRACLCYHGTC